MVSDPYPLLLDPIYKPKPWGGRRFQTVLGREAAPAGNIGESWELSDLDGDASVIRNGPSKGWTLRRAMQTWGERLTGRMPLCDGRFPLLIKYLDAREALSIQVHPAPNEDHGSREALPDGRGSDGGSSENPLPYGRGTDMYGRGTDMYGRGADMRGSDWRGSAMPYKHEAWYVIEAQPGGCIYRGVHPGVSLSDLRKALGEGDVDRVVRRMNVKPGQAYYLPAGIVHALGAGVLVAEVQTPCDVTYRLFDWGRADPATGQLRDLHMDDGLACARLDLDPTPAERRSHVASVWTTVTRLITCPSFTVEHVRMVDGAEQDVPYSEPVVWMVLSGKLDVSCEADGKRVSYAGVRGDTMLLPAALKHPRVRASGPCTWLEITVPTPSDLTGYAKPDAAALRGLTEPSPLVQLGTRSKEPE